MNNMRSESYPEAQIQEWLEELRPFLYRLLDSWSVRRLYDETRDSYLKQAKEHVQDLMNEMITESEDKTQRLSQEIKYQMEALDKLSKELDKKVNLSPYEELPLDLVKEKLNEEVHQLKMCKEELMNRYNQLRRREYEICKKVGAKPIHFDKKVPSEPELEQLLHYVEIQENEKNRLEREFLETRDRILKMLNNLQANTDNDFQKLVQNEPDKFLYTKSNMQLLSDWEKHLKNRIEQIEKRVREKREDIKALWKYLDEPAQYCQEFLKKHSDNTPQTYRTIEAEIERCKAKRAENTAKYIGRIRNELANLWDLCKFSEEQRNHFVPIHCQNFTDSLLTLHELEVNRLRKFYQENKKIYDLVQEYESIIEQMKILDRRAMDPDRLHNRGGQLLAEERERKIANKKLPKVQEQIMQHLQEYEKLHKEIFTLNGVSVEEYFCDIWDRYNKEKENIKSEVKKQAKDKSAKKTPQNTSKWTPRTLSLRQVDPSKSVKRKLLDESTLSPHTTKGQVASAEKSKKKKTPNYVVKRGKFTTRKSLNRSGKERYNVSKTRAENTESLSSSYEQFQEHLLQREDLRSSCLPNQVLLGMNGGVTKMKTPVKTPAKPLRKVLRQAEVPAKSPKLPGSVNLSVKSPRLLRSSNTSTNSRSPKVKTQLTVLPGNMPLFL